MSRTHVFGWSAAAAGALLVLCSSPASAQTAKTPTFTKDIAPIFQAKCEACHRPDNMAPMSLVDLRRRAAVGEVDRAARRRAADAAVAHRQDGRHPEVQERSLAERRADRHDPARGSPPARRRATRRTCRRRSSGRTRRAGSWPTKYGAAGSRREVARVHDARRSRRTPGGGRPCRPGLTEPRWVRAIEIRPVGKNARKITHHALAPPAAAGRHERPSSSPTIRTSPGDGLFMEWAVGKNGDEMRPGLGPPDAARIRRSSGRCTITRSARRSRRTPSSACGSIRRARSRSTAKCSALFNTFSGTGARRARRSTSRRTR